jgi:hypothetical protein
VDGHRPAEATLLEFAESLRRIDMRTSTSPSNERDIPSDSEGHEALPVGPGTSACADPQAESGIREIILLIHGIRDEGE